MINLDAAKATIAWIGAAGGRPEPRLVAAASALGYRLITRVADERVDIAAIDARGAEASAKLIGQAVAEARRLVPAAGILIAASRRADAATRGRLRRLGEVASLGEDASPFASAIRERLRLASLVDETSDRLKSLVAFGRTASFAPVAVDGRRPSVLIAGAPSPLTLNACNAFRGSADARCVFTAGQAMRALDHMSFDGAVFLPSGENDILLALARALRRHRQHGRLPVLIASDDNSVLDCAASHDGFDRIAAAHIADDLAPRLELAARRAWMAATMRTFLRSSEGCAGGRNGAAGARFFAHHATRLFRHADGSGERLSLAGAALTLRSLATGDPGLAAAVNDAARTASKILRAEDMVAKLSTGAIVCLLRGARAGEAHRVANRLEGVLSGALAQSTLAVASVTSASVERRAGDGVETTLASLLHGMREQRRAG